MRTTTARKLTAALVAPLAVATGLLVPAGTPAGAAPTITRIDLGGSTDAEMLAPDGAGKVWFALPGTQTYGYVSSGVVTSLTNGAATIGNNGQIAVFAGNAYLWARHSAMSPPNIDGIARLYRVGADDVETVVNPYQDDRAPRDMVADATAGIWTAFDNEYANAGAVIGALGACPIGNNCQTSYGPDYSGMTIDGNGDLWAANANYQFGGQEKVARITPAGSSPIAATEFWVSDKIDKLAWSGNSLFASVPGQSVLRQVIPGTAPNVTEIDYGVSGAVGDVETDGAGNVWFAIAGSAKLGVLRNGSIQELTIPAAARRLAYDASTDQLWWSESGTHSVAHLHVASALSDLFPTTTTTTTAAPTTTTTTVATDTTAPTAALATTALRMDRAGTVRPTFGPASEPMAVIAQLRVGGTPVGLGGTLVPAGGTRPVALVVPRRFRPAAGRTLAATVVVARIGAARNTTLESVAVTIRR